MAETKMSQEMAEKEFDRWADEQGIPTADSDMDDETAALWSACKKRIVKALADGSAVVNDKVNLVYTISSKSPDGYAGDEIEISPPTTRAFMAGSQYKENQSVQKAMAVASALTGKDVGWFANLFYLDYKFFAAVVNLFLIS